ncbi:MAG: carbohydrate kinase family protein [Chloroflexi bacterium]|nr:carbohydrate kinase family protein [Chloroflexota bacterium]
MKEANAARSYSSPGNTLVTIGDLVLDVLLEVQLPVGAGGHQTARSLRYEAGGACTTILAARGMGLDVAALGAVGDDLPGRFLFELLVEAGVDIVALQMLPDSTTTTVLSLSDRQQGGHVFLGRYGQGGVIDFSDMAAQRLTDAAAIFIPGYTLLEERLAGLVEGAFAWLALQSRRIYFDVGPFLGGLQRDRVDEVLRLVDVLLLTEDEIAFVAHDLRDLQRRHPQLSIVLKLGERGCRILSGGTDLHVPSIAVEVIDTIGAGDAFAAAFIWAELQGHSLADCGTIANAMGAASVGRAGAGRNVPSRAELQALLDAHNRGIDLTC